MAARRNGLVGALTQVTLTQVTLTHVTLGGLTFDRRAYRAYRRSGFTAKPHPLFDPVWYARTYLPGAAGTDPLAHYLAHAGSGTVDPNPYFDTRFYLAMYPEARDYASPLAHWCAAGCEAGHRPNLLFDPAYYRARYGDITERVRDCLRHYAEHGAAEQRSTHPLFDAAWYGRAVGDLQGLDPLRHILRHGLAEGRDPHPLLDLAFLAGQADPRPARDLLFDYLHRPACYGLDPHPAFVAEHYYAHTRGADRSVNPLVHYLSVASAYGRPNAVFDSNWYLDAYPDIFATGANPLVHYVTYGYREGRNPSEALDTAFYLRTNPDLRQTGLDPVSHYLRHGRAEGRAPRPARHAAPGGGDGVREASDRLSRIRADSFLGAGLAVRFPATAAPKVSIILVLFNKAHLTLDCVRSIAETIDAAACPYEVILFDNASRDGTGTLLDRIENATILRSPENLGFLRAVNAAAAQARGESLLLLNNDTILLPGSVAAAERVLSGEPGVGAVGGKLILPSGRLQEAGSIVWSDGSCVGYARDADPDAFEANFRRDVDYCSGAFLMLKRALFRDLGGFDEAYAPAYYEETDLCTRIRERGLRIVYDPFVALVHVEFGSAAPDGRQEAASLQGAHRAVFAARHAETLAGQHPPDLSNLLAARSSPPGAPRILYIDNKVPHPTLGAGYPRARTILNLLAGLGAEVTLLPTDDAGEPWHQVRQALAPTIEVAFGYAAHAIYDFLKARHDHYDAILVSRPHNMERIKRILETNPDVLERPLLWYDAEAIVSSREIGRRAVLGDPVSEEAGREMVAAELAVAAPADLVICVSDQEAAAFRAAGKETVRIGHVLAPEPGERPFGERRDLLFVGGFPDETSPNTDSIVWFIDHVLPLVRARLPECRLILAGENRSELIRARLDDRVVCLGRVDDLRPVYDRARLFVAPTRFAAGIPHKVHEAAAAGLPVVATPLLAGQLGWSNGRELMVGGTAEDFAEACLALSRDEALWERLRAGALAAVRRDCGEEVVTAALRGLLERIPRGSGPRSP
ncbi:glycosyltransferase [Methylobacterium variabile]|uniref:glycosyltransferase n=1 Tax=Methylobacterium variabile TaxID=298794 RepID=UPI00069F4262|nr:glycosyltransferase [Methylobacterium variabile]